MDGCPSPEAARRAATAVRIGPDPASGWNALEMRKADLIGRLIASAGFDKSVAPADLLQLIRLLEVVSWRQLLAMAWIEREAWDEQCMMSEPKGRRARASYALDSRPSFRNWPTFIT